MVKNEPVELAYYDLRSGRKYYNRQQPATRKNKKTLARNSTDDRRLDESNVFLPDDVLMHVFSLLPLRDLCAAERVCKRWRRIVLLLWSCTRRLVLDKQSCSQSASAFILHQLVRSKALGASLTHLDMSDFFNIFTNQLTLRPLSDHCPNLASINLQGKNVSDPMLVSLAFGCRRLREIILAECSWLTDFGFGQLFLLCKELASVDMSKCYGVRGACLVLVPHSLRQLNLRDCSQIADKWILRMTERHSAFTHLTLNFPLQADTIRHVVGRLERIVDLRMQVDEQFFNETVWQCVGRGSRLFDALTFLEMESSDDDDDDRDEHTPRATCRRASMRMLLESATRLRDLRIHMQVEWPSELTTINAPLESLWLDGEWLDDHTLVASICSLQQLKRTLVSLTLSRCVNVTCQAVCQAIAELSELRSLSLSEMPNIDNRVISAALEVTSLRSTHMNLYFMETGIEPGAIVDRHGQMNVSIIGRRRVRLNWPRLTVVHVN